MPLLSDAPDDEPAARLAPYCRLLIQDLQARTVLIGGDGGERLARLLRLGDGPRVDVFAAEHPGPAAPAYDLVLHLGMLPRLAEEEIGGALAALAQVGRNIFFAIPTIPANTLTDAGENAHRTIRDGPWWQERLAGAFPDAAAVPAFADEEPFFVSWRPSDGTLRGLKAHKRALKLRNTIGRVLGAPIDLLRLSRQSFVAEQTLLEALEGRSVALVGNSPRLAEGALGAEIDAADLVIRINRAPLMSVRSHGRRTDWIATGVPLSPAFVEARNPRFVLWMTKLRRMPRWMIGRPIVHLYPRRRMAELERQIGRRPSTGFMLIDLLRRSQCRSAALYGFDFFESLSLSGWRRAIDVPHDFSRERHLVEEIVMHDKRFTHRR